MKRFLATLVVAFSIAAIAQTHTVPTLDRNNVWTGTNDFTTLTVNGSPISGTFSSSTPYTWAAAQTFNASAALDAQILNSVQYATPSTTGADFCAKIATAIGRLPSTGGTVSARGLQGAQACSTDPLAGVTKPVELLLCGTTVTSSATWSLVNGLTIRGCGISLDGSNTSVKLVYSGTGWMFQSADITQRVANVLLTNITVDLSSNTSAIGAFDFSGVGRSVLNFPTVKLPTGGSGIIGVKFADPNNVYGYFNTVNSPYIYATTRANNHIGFWMTANGNDHKIFGGATEKVGQPVVIDNTGGAGGGNGNTFFGTAFENFQAHAVTLGNSASANTFVADRAENTAIVPTSLVRSANTVTATFAGGHNLSSNISWGVVGGVVKIAGSTAATNIFDGTFSPTVVNSTTLTWTQSGANETATGTGTFSVGDIFWASSTSARSHFQYPNPVGMARNFLDQATDTDYTVSDPLGNSAARWSMPVTFGSTLTNRPTINTVSSFAHSFGNASTTAGTYGMNISMGSTDPTTLGLNVQFGGTSSLRVWPDGIQLGAATKLTGQLGTAAKIATTSASAPASNKCVEFDTSGNLVVAGSNAACGAGGGAGTVTVVSSGALTSTALVTGGGTTTLQTPAATATMDSSGNITTPGTITAASIIVSGAAGADDYTQIAAPASPAASHLSAWADSTDARFHDKNPAGTIGTTVVGAGSRTANQFVTNIGVDGVQAKAAIVAADVPSTLTSGTAITNANLTTPTLGVASVTTINKVTITAPATSATLTILNGKTATFNNSVTFAGTDTTTMTFPTTSATLARTDAANTFTGHQTVEGVTSTGATGTGKFVFDGSPVLVTPNLGTPSALTLTNATGLPGAGLTNNSVTATQLAAQYSKLSCQPGLGDGLNAMAAGTYLQSSCYNDTGVTVTITGIKCFTDNSGTSALSATNGAGTALLTGAVTCSTAFAAGTQSGTVTIASGDFIKFSFVADGTSKQTTWVITSTN